VVDGDAALNEQLPDVAIGELRRRPEGRWLSGSSRLHRGRVTRSAYYAWTISTARGPSQHERAEAALVVQIRRIHAHSPGTRTASTAITS